MRRLWVLLVFAVVGLCCAAPATADPQAPGTALTPDGFGVIAGSPTAPVQLEFFCDPQCPDCASFESDFDADLSRYLGSGQLALTYRWLTFLDDRRHNDTSARVAAALMSVADPATTATSYQAFVADLYRHQDRDRGPAADEIAGLARESGIPEQLVEPVAAGQARVDTAAMNAANRARLDQVNPDSPTTPTVYDLTTGRVVDTAAPDWLSERISAR